MGICDNKKDLTKAVNECDTHHAKPIPESINEKLYNSIVKIKTDCLLQMDQRRK